MYRTLIGRILLPLYSVESRFIGRKPMCSRHGDDWATLETLQFDNKVLRELPVDENIDNSQRQVRAVCFSRCVPTPLSNPRLVIYSPSALQLLDLPSTEIDRPDFVEYFSGNKLLPGSKPAAHCYCGHQFGYFAGQLGDGAATYLGEILNKHGERWEVQLKGAGKTPFSRTADGRKVLRSSVREFLCSEAMFHLGVPTTRAGCCLTSDSTVVRDIFYSGNPQHENCAVITRIAQSFIRFGSFEICKEVDHESGRVGPSCGHPQVLQKLADYVLNNFYPEICNQRNPETSDSVYIELFKEVVKKTASLVAQWQCLGFCHGVLNTDNMSILGLTIDYGPFGFLDRYDPNHVSNASDDGGRYAFNKQPEICKWNCLKLAEALSLLAPLNKLLAQLDLYDQVYQQCYMDGMRKKLGLLAMQLDTDSELVETLLETMDRTGADYTNTFRCLSRVSFSQCSPADVSQLKVDILRHCATVHELELAYAPRIDTRQLAMFKSLLESNPQMLQGAGKGFRQVVMELDRHEKLQQIKTLSAASKQELDSELWDAWLSQYIARLHAEVCTTDSSKASAMNESRKSIMNSVNPQFILRNHIAQKAIEAAQVGNYTELERVFELLQHPYEDLTTLEQLIGFSSGGKHQSATLLTCQQSSDTDINYYTSKAPSWSSSLRLT